MKPNEFIKKGLFSTKYALGVAIGIEEGKTIESEAKLAKEFIRRWVMERGKSAAEILITVVAPEEEQESIAKFLGDMAKSGAPLVPEPAKIPVKVELIAVDTKRKISFRIS